MKLKTRRDEELPDELPSLNENLNGITEKVLLLKEYNHLKEIKTNSIL